MSIHLKKKLIKKVIVHHFIIYTLEVIYVYVSIQ